MNYWSTAAEMSLLEAILPTPPCIKSETLTLFELNRLEGAFYNSDDGIDVCFGYSLFRRDDWLALLRMMECATNLL